MTEIIDLFAGIGGFHKAFANLGAKTVFASEKDKNARKTYEANFSKTDPELFKNGNFAGDITLIDPKTIPDFNILTGGFPCQPFSNAGKRGGFQDTRGTLFFNIANILKEKQPEAFFLENVRGLLSHDDGKTFKVIENAVHQLGYSFYYRVVKASDHGVPQNRPRLFMVGFREDIELAAKAKGVAFDFPEPVPLVLTLSKLMGGKVTTVAGAEKTIGFTLRVGGRGSGVFDRRNWDSYLVDGIARRITIDEAKKLQGFPASYMFPVSETQAFKQLGNSVAVPAIQATAKKLLAVLEAANS